MARQVWLSDAAWARIEPHRPRGQPGKPRVDDRRAISGILHVLKVGRRWQDTPAACGPHTTIYNRCNRWARRGVWRRVATRHDRLARDYLAAIARVSCLIAWA